MGLCMGSRRIIRPLMTAVTVVEMGPGGLVSKLIILITRKSNPDYPMKNLLTKSPWPFKYSSANE